MKKISIIGFGRFGKTLLRMVGNDFLVVLYDKNKSVFKDLEFKKNVSVTQNINEIYQSDAIFFCVPISEFEKVITEHKSYFSNKTLLVDVLSVKMHPKKVFTKALKGTRMQAMLTHPMFGPESSKNGFTDLPIIIDKFRADDRNYKFWREYFNNKCLKVVEMKAEEHDKIAANTQGLTHFIGRLLDVYGFRQSKMDSLGTKKLLEVKEQTVNDTWQLFNDLQRFNPYTKRMRIKLGEAYDRLYNKLLPDKVYPNHVTFGIQGGKGSFNEEALKYYLDRKGIKNFKVQYLYTSENVLKNLNEGNIDLGQFAIHNSVGGIVGESIEAMAKFKFRIVEQFAIKISHSLMIRADANLEDIDTIMSHPQVFAQCKTTLLKKYPDLKLVSGKGKLIDHALVAKRLSEGTLTKNIATMGSKILANLYNLKVVEDNFQDAKENYTSFLLIERI